MSVALQGKIVTVLGAARSGIAVANTVIALGGQAQISEFKSRDAVSAELEGLSLTAKVEFGGHTKEFVLRSDLIVLSPGVRMDIPPVKWANEAGIDVIGEIEFAYCSCPCPIVAVTGSNGKTTTVTLIAEVLKKAGKNAVLCGNIGSPFSAHVLTLKPTDIAVLEVSSFQLESTSTFKPAVAVWLNFAPNHLDRHKDLAEYFDAKKKILANLNAGDTAVLNGTQEDLRKLGHDLTCKVVYFNSPEDIDPDLNPNQKAVVAVASVFGVSIDVCKSVFATFKGVEHRHELVRTIAGVDYINDSKSTTPEAGQWALTHLKKPLVMICGGSDKYLTFDHLKNLVKSRVKHMVVIGQTREQLHQTFADVVPVSVADSLADAVNKAKSVAVPGDAVVLSPMCASFDMFNNFEHRGSVFKDIVRGLS